MDVPAALLPALALTQLSSSPVRARQLRWVAGELGRYAALQGPGRRPVGPSGWLAANFTAGYLAAASDGLLRVRAPSRGAPTSDQVASNRVRYACLRLLAAAADVPDPCGPTPPDPPRKPGPDLLALRLGLARLRALAADPRADPLGQYTRVCAMLELALPLGLRTGELAALRLDDVRLYRDPVQLAVWAEDLPPAATSRRPVRHLLLDGAAAKAMRNWLDVRAHVCAATPREGALWVSLAGNHDGQGRRRPAGLGLRPNGIRRAITRAVHAVNVDLASTPGYRPLPGQLSSLRTAAGRAGDSRPG